MWVLESLDFIHSGKRSVATIPFGGCYVIEELDPCNVVWKLHGTSEATEEKPELSHGECMAKCNLHFRDLLIKHKLAKEF